MCIHPSILQDLQDAVFSHNQAQKVLEVARASVDSHVSNDTHSSVQDHRVIQAVSTSADPPSSSGDYASDRTIAPPPAPPSMSNYVSAAPIVVEAPLETCESKAFRYALALWFGLALTSKGVGQWWRWPYRVCLFAFFLYWIQWGSEWAIRISVANANTEDAYVISLNVVSVVTWITSMPAMFVWTVWWIERHSYAFLRRLRVFVSSHKHKSFRPWFWAFYVGTIVIIVGWTTLNAYGASVKLYLTDYEYYTDIYLKEVEAGDGNATCCPAFPLDMYERLTPLDGPEEIFWAVRVAGIVQYIWHIFMTGAVLWHSAIWSLELIMFW